MKCSIFAWLWPAAGMLVLACVPALAADQPAQAPAAPAAAAKAEAAKAPAAEQATAKEPAAKPPATAEQPAAKPAAAAAQPAAKAAAAEAVPAGRSPYRPLAPWVMQTVDPMRSLGETVSHHDVVEVLAADPNLAWAKDISFRHDVWALEFKFKPVRMIWVDVPYAGGQMQRKLIWYLVYSITNTGKVFHPTEDADLKYATSEKKQLYRVVQEDHPVRFLPEFELDTYQRLSAGTISNKHYPDRVIPVAMTAIRMREDPKRQFLNTVEMCREIGVGETFWGIATWEDVDLATYQFSVVVSGLTNSYRWEDKPGAYKAGDPPLTGRKFFRRMLKLNFWRPADQYFAREEEIRYGVPGGVDYEWVYR